MFRLVRDDALGTKPCYLRDFPGLKDLDFSAFQRYDLQSDSPSIELNKVQFAFFTASVIRDAFFFALYHPNDYYSPSEG